MTLALPGSVIENTQTLERATAVAGLVARTAAIFCIDEVIVIDDAPNVGCAGLHGPTWQLFAGPRSCPGCLSASPTAFLLLFMSPMRGPAAAAGRARPGVARALIVSGARAGRAR